MVKVLAIAPRRIQKTRTRRPLSELAAMETYSVWIPSVVSATRVSAGQRPVPGRWMTRPVRAPVAGSTPATYTPLPASHQASSAWPIAKPTIA